MTERNLFFGCLRHDRNTHFSPSFFGWLNWHGLLVPSRFVLIYTFFGRFTEFFVGFYSGRFLTAGAIRTST